MLKKLLNLSDNGEKNLKKAILVCTFTNIVLFFPYMVIMQIMQYLITPLSNGEALDIKKLWLLLGFGVIVAIVYGLTYAKEYDMTYTTAYSESTSIRVEVAERMRRLPLSFFNRKDLSELTTNMIVKFFYYYIIFRNKPLNTFL